jgi:hypothetical protein
MLPSLGLTAALLAAAASQLGCAAIAGVVPPSRTEIGSTVIADGANPTTGLRFATGAHLASGQTRRDAKLDVGVGYVYERVGAPVAAEMDTGGYHVEPEAAPLCAHGGYVEVARALESSYTHRSWIAARGEMLSQGTVDGGRRMVNGAYARLAWEVYSTGAAAGGGSDPKVVSAGFAYGAVALGLYVESGYRAVEGERAAFVATGGLSLRLPVFGGFAIGFK